MRIIQNKNISKAILSNLLFSLILVALVSCNHQNTTEQASSSATINNNLVSLTAAQAKNANLEIGQIEKRNISTVLKLNGQIDVPPQNMVSISMPLGGYLKSTSLLPGMHINKGEVIAIMEDQAFIQLQQDYLITKSKLNFAEKEYVRQKTLNGSQASSDKVFQQAEADFKTLKITLGALAERLRLININPKTLTENNISKSIRIYAPINGYVSRVNVNIGKYVSPTDVLFELINPSDIHLNLKVFEKDIDKLFIGQKLKAYTNNEPDKKYDCEIILVSKDFAADRTADVHCHFERFEKKLLPGMYMNAEVEVKSENANALPEDAIVNFDGKDYVFVVEKQNQFKMTEVTTGANENGFLQIYTASLKGKSIVTKGAYTLLMKLKNKADDEE